MKTLARKEKGRQRQRIDGLRSVAQDGAQILHVKGYDIVSADKIGTFAKLFEGRDIARMKETTVGTARTQINDLAGFRRHFGINKDDGVLIEGARQQHGTFGQSG